MHWNGIEFCLCTPLSIKNISFQRSTHKGWYLYNSLKWLLTFSINFVSLFSFSFKNNSNALERRKFVNMIKSVSIFSPSLLKLIFSVLASNFDWILHIVVIHAPVFCLNLFINSWLSSNFFSSGFAGVGFWIFSDIKFFSSLEGFGSVDFNLVLDDLAIFSSVNIAPVSCVTVVQSTFFDEEMVQIWFSLQVKA